MEINNNLSQHEQKNVKTIFTQKLFCEQHLISNGKYNNNMKELLETNSHLYEIKVKWQSQTPRPGSSYTITPWQSDFQKAVDKQIKGNIAAAKTIRRPIIRPIESPRRSPRIQSHMSIDNPMTTTKIQKIQFHGHSPTSIVDDHPRTHRSIEARGRVSSLKKHENILKLPNLTKLKALPAKLGLRGKKLMDKIRLEQLVNVYSPRAEKNTTRIESHNQTFQQEIVPINLKQEFQRKKGGIPWMGGRRQDIMSKLYSQIRSTIRLS